MAIDYGDLDFGEEEIALKEVPVRVAGKTYILTEADGEAAIAYRKAKITGVQVTEDSQGKQRFTLPGGIATLVPTLVSRCLWSTKQVEIENGTLPPKNKKVPEGIVRSWNPTIQNKLYAKIKELSPGLDEDVDEDNDSVKNSSSGIEDGS